MSFSLFFLNTKDLRLTGCFVDTTERLDFSHLIWNDLIF